MLTTSTLNRLESNESPSDTVLYAAPGNHRDAPPVDSLVATTEEATRALGGRSEVRVTTFPFRVGRDRRVGAFAHPTSRDLRLGVESQSNDVYLPDPLKKHLHISGEHFAVEYATDKSFLRDRGSACGTIVAGRQIGGVRKEGRTELRSGDEIVVGTDRSPYVFRFETADD